VSTEVRQVPNQLEMRRAHLDGLPALQPPPGCLLRSYRPGDETHWARIMNECVGEGWTPERARRELVERPEFRADGCFFAEVAGVPQGTATAWHSRAAPEGDGYVHMVGVARAARGLGLGMLVTLATLHWFREHGYRGATLNTDDWRLPAIGVYLKLGFQPVLFNEEHERRWREVRARLAQARPGVA
jgi:mycothiol synthase